MFGEEGRRNKTYVKCCYSVTVSHVRLETHEGERLKSDAITASLLDTPIIASRMGECGY